MNSSTTNLKSQIFKLSVIALLAVGSLFLSGAVAQDNSSTTLNEQKLSKIESSLSAVKAENNNFSKLTQTDPMLMLSISSQSFDAQKHKGLWK